MCVFVASYDINACLFDPKLSDKNANIIKVCRRSNALKMLPREPGRTGASPVECFCSRTQFRCYLTNFNVSLTLQETPNRFRAIAQLHLVLSNAAAGTLSPDTVGPVFCALIHHSSTSSVQLNVLVEKCVTPALPADLITRSTASLAVLASPHNETWLLATEKSITSVSHDYGCFLWLYLCTLTGSPFTETVTRGQFVSVRECR